MSVPSIFATGHHLDLSLSGNRVSILDSIKVNSLASSVHTNYNKSLKNHEVLPSITPTDSRSVSQESIQHQTSSVCLLAEKPNVQHPTLPKSEVTAKVTEECWIDQEDEENKEQVDSEDKDDRVDDQWEDDSQDDTADKTPSSEIKKKKRKRKKRKSSKHIFKSAKSDRLKNTEDIYTDMAVLERKSKLEAFCVPAKIGSFPKQSNKKCGTEYLQFVNEKAPQTSQKFQPQIRAEKLLIKTKDLLTAVSAKTNGLKEKIRSGKTSTDSTKQLKNSLTSSVDAVTFQLQLAKSGPVLSRKSLSSAPCDNDIPRITKVYLSEKQSKDLCDVGMEFPGAPPGTPTTDMLKKFEYVPSMGDIRSQRAVKLKLECLVKLEKQKQEKIKEEKARKDKVQQKEKIRELRRQQRREIYALNKLMTEFENKNFREFCRQNGIDPDS